MLLAHSCKAILIDTHLHRTNFFGIMYIYLCVCNSAITIVLCRLEITENVDTTFFL